jgi:flagellin-like hook-associated protein FlgL
MSGIVLSASVRQNLLALQSTADLLASTQNALATGKKVSSALDNPTNFFTAQELNNRASDIHNLLDGISNGVQVLQAANSGITSLQSLIDSAKSIANQALQTTIGYSTKSNVSTTIAGATASDLRGTTSFTNATATGNVLFDGTAGGSTTVSGTTSLGGVSGVLQGSVINANTTAASALTGNANPGDLNANITNGQQITVNGHTVTFNTGAAPTSPPAGFTQVTQNAGAGLSGNVYTDANGNAVIYTGTKNGANNVPATVADLETAIDIASGVQSNVAGTPTQNKGQAPSTIAGGALTLHSSTGSDLNITGTADFLKQLGLTSATGGGSVTVNAARTTNGASAVAPVAAGTLSSLLQAGSSLNVDGHTINFKDGPVPAASSLPAGSSIAGAGPGAGGDQTIVTDGKGNSTVYLQTANISDVLAAIDLATGVQTVSGVTQAGLATLQTTAGTTSSSVVSGALKISTGVNADLSITGTGNALSVLGLGGNTGTATAFTASRNSGTGGINGKNLTFTSFNSGKAVNVTFGDGTNGTVKTLDQLNAALQADNLTATVDTNGLLTISASNDFASSTLGSAAAGGAIGGTLTGALTFSTASAPVADATAQATRAGLVASYNAVVAQIDSTTQDASSGGVNLLNGDQLKLVFDETGKSSLSITGVTFNSTGLGLTSLTSGTDFIDNASTNKVLAQLNNASSTLRSEASALGSNLSIVQIRQDFSTSIINVLQTGSANLTQADPNEEAANSQALSTRQSIAISALALANQSQQSVLQLLR